MKIKAFLMLWLCLFFSAAHAAPGLIKPSEIHPGMVGYGKTVFQGTKIETFKVVVLGVLKKALADQDLILVRIESPYLKKKGIGLVAGMSGSPVYFNGRLAGAVAYGWPFTPEPIAGITPIHAMLRSGPEGRVEHLARKSLPAVRVPQSLTGGKSSGASMQLEPLGISVSASGFDVGGIKELQDLFPMLHVVPGGAPVSVKRVDALVPGQAVGAALMEGDMSLVATGTLTYRDGSRVLAFGHPFLFLGNVDFPMVQSYVHYILPSIQLPFKFASPIREVGNVSQDRMYGIGGILGKRARMVPMDLTVVDQERGLRQRLHVEIIRHPDFTPRLAALAIDQAIPSAAKLLGGATARLEYDLEFEGHRPLHVKNVVFSEQSISSAASSEILKSMLQVTQNDFQMVQLKRVRARVSILPKLAAATIQKVMISRHRLKPGEPLSVTVYLKPYNEPVVKRKVDLNLPSDIQGSVLVGVGGGVNDDQLRKILSQPPPHPLTVNQIIRQVEESAPYNTLVVRLSYPRRSVSWAGENFGNLPQPYADLLKAAGSSPVTFQADGAEFRLEMPWVIVGTEVQEVTIEGKETTAPQRPPAPPLPGPIPPAAPVSQMGNAQQTVEAQPPLQPPPPNPFPLPPPSAGVGEEHKTTREILGDLKDWQEGTLKGLAISPHGDLSLGPHVRTAASFDENVLLAQAVVGETVYVGTANPGRIYRVRKNKDKELFYDPQTVAVLSLAPLPQGDLLAGFTGGRLLWLDPNGRVKFQWQLTENYIWQIVPMRDLVYVATGSPQGKIYRISLSAPSPSPELLYGSSQSHITSLFPFESGQVFAGTANNGLILEVDPDGSARTLYDLDEQAVLSMTGDAQGNVYIGTSGKGKVYLLDYDRNLKKLAELPEENVTWLGMDQDKILAGAGIPARLYSVDKSGNLSLLWDGKASEQVALVGDPRARWFNVSGGHASLFEVLSGTAQHGEFLSRVLDSNTRALWGRLFWRGHLPPDAEIKVQTRTGNSAVPDASWSPWSRPYAMEGRSMENPPGRYLQIKVSLSRSKLESPRLEAVHFFWRAANLPPGLAVSEPEPGAVVGPKNFLRGKLKDRDGDTLRLELWKERTSDPPEKLFSNLYPISKAKGGEEDFSIPLSVIRKEGDLALKLVVSDSPVNDARSALSHEVLIKDLTYDATPPTMTGLRVTNEKGVVRVEGTALDATSYVKAVQFRINGGPWMEAIPSSGIFDSAQEAFSFQLENLSEVRNLEIRALDGADNETVTRLPIPSSLL